LAHPCKPEKGDAPLQVDTSMSQLPGNLVPKPIIRRDPKPKSQVRTPPHKKTRHRLTTSAPPPIRRTRRVSEVEVLLSRMRHPETPSDHIEHILYELEKHTTSDDPMFQTLKYFVYLSRLAPSFTLDAFIGWCCRVVCRSLVLCPPHLLSHTTSLTHSLCSQLLTQALVGVYSLSGPAFHRPRFFGTSTFCHSVSGTKRTPPSDRDPTLVSKTAFCGRSW
jgi:hypothetical protein